MTTDILGVLTQALKHEHCNVIHFVSTPVLSAVDIELTSQVFISRNFEGSTTCGKRLGGMLYGDLTRVPDQVTCEACLHSKRFPLDELSSTEL